MGRFRLGFLGLCLSVGILGGCGKGPNPEEPKPSKDVTGPPPVASEPTAEADLTAGELFQKSQAYVGKWVRVSGVTPRVNVTSLPDGSTSARVLIQDQISDDCWAEFNKTEWPKVPKLEDGVRYDILGKVGGNKNTGVTLQEARFLGVSQGRGPTAEATVSAGDLVESGNKYQGKLILVKGEVVTGGPGESGGTVTLTGKNGRQVICLFNPGELDRALKAGRRGTLEIKGTVSDTAVNIVLGGCTTVSATSTVRSENATNVTRSFATDSGKAETHYKKNGMMLQGKVDSVTDTQIKLKGYTDSKGKVPAQNVAALFAPNWKELVQKVKAGDTVTISGEFERYKDNELSLSNCWLIPR